MKKRQSLIVILFLLSAIFNTIGQSIDDYKNWTLSVEKEIPNLDIEKLERRSNLHHTISTNLLSDKFFIAFYKKPFNQLNREDKAKLLVKIRKLAGKKSAAKNGWQKRLSFYLSGALNSQNAKSTMQMLERLKLLRTEYNLFIVNHGKNNGVKSRRVSSFLGRYSYLLPAEIENVKSISKQAHTLKNDNELLKKVDKYLVLSKDLNSLGKLKNFKHDNRWLFEYASYKVKSQATSKVVAYEKSIIDFLIKKEIKKIEETNSKDITIPQLKDWERSTLEPLGRYYTPTYKEYRGLYMRKKASVIIANHKQIEQQISRCVTIKELNTYTNWLFSEVNDVEEIKHMIVLRDIRKAQINGKKSPPELNYSVLNSKKHVLIKTFTDIKIYEPIKVDKNDLFHIELKNRSNGNKITIYGFEMESTIVNIDVVNAIDFEILINEIKNKATFTYKTCIEKDSNVRYEFISSIKNKISFNKKDNRISITFYDSLDAMTAMIDINTDLSFTCDNSNSKIFHTNLKCLKLSSCTGKKSEARVDENEDNGFKICDICSKVDF
jgi:hypothetical protein